MLELKTGEVNHDELAEWFGLSTESLLKHK